MNRFYSQTNLPAYFLLKIELKIISKNINEIDETLKHGITKIQECASKIINNIDLRN